MFATSTKANAGPAAGEALLRSVRAATQSAAGGYRRHHRRARGGAVRRRAPTACAWARPSFARRTRRGCRDRAFSSRAGTVTDASPPTPLLIVGWPARRGSACAGPSGTRPATGPGRRPGTRTARHAPTAPTSRRLDGVAPRPAPTAAPIGRRPSRDVRRQRPTAEPEAPDRARRSPVERLGRGPARRPNRRARHACSSARATTRSRRWSTATCRHRRRAGRGGQIDLVVPPPLAGLAIMIENQADARPQTGLTACRRGLRSPGRRRHHPLHRHVLC